MAYRPDDPYNIGIGTPYLGNINMGQVPVNRNVPMQVAEAINYRTLPQAKEAFEGSYPFGYSKSSSYGGNKYTGTTKGDFYDALEKGTFGMKTEDMFNKNITDLFKGVADEEIGTGMFFDAKPTWERTGTGFDYKGNIDVPKKDLGEDLLKTLPEGFWKDDDQASLDDEYDFSDIEGQTAVLGLPELFGMITKGGISKQAIKKALIRDQISKQIGKKVKPVLTGVLTGGKADAAAPTSHEEAQATGGDYHGGQKSTVDGQTTDWGPNSAMIARGGLAQRAPRYANGGLIDFFRYGGFIG